MQEIPKLPQTTFMKITIGFDRNKRGNSRVYKIGEGKNAIEAVEALFRQKANNIFTVEQKNEFLAQLNLLISDLKKKKFF